MTHAAPAPLHVRLLMADTGGGHRATAEALAASLTAQDPEARVEVVDLFSEAGGPARIPPLWYAWLMTHPKVWGAMFHALDGRRRRFFVWAPFYFSQERTYRRLITEDAPHAVVVVHPGFTAGTRRAVSKTDETTAICTVVTDPISGHASWYEAGMDLTVVSTDEAAERARTLGVEDETIEVVDHPVHPRIPALSRQRDDLRRRYGWSDRKVVLCTGGGDAAGTLSTVAAALRENTDAHVVVVCGRNQALRKALSAIDGLEVLGFVDDLPERMAAADVVVTKAGPSTLAEAGAVGTPVVVYDHMPGQEVGNLQWVTSRGWGRVADQLAQVAPQVNAWLDDVDARRALRDRAQAKAGSPTASDRIARLLLERARDAYQARARQDSAHDEGRRIAGLQRLAHLQAVFQ